MTISTMPINPVGYDRIRMHSGMAGMGSSDTRTGRVLSAGRGVVSSLVDQVTASGGLVRSVTLRSNLSPDLVLDPNQIAGPGYGGYKRRGGINEALLALAKPEIEIDTAAGRIRVAPWGSPTTNLFWPITIIGTASIVALGVLVLKGYKK